MFNKILKIVSLCLFYLTLGIVFTYPLINHFNSKIPNGYIIYKNPIVWGDHLQLLSHAREHKNILKNFIQQEPIYQKEFCFGEVEDCQMGMVNIIKNSVFSPHWVNTVMRLFGNDIFAYNVNILFSFITTGLAGFYLSKLFIKQNIIHFKIFHKKLSFDISDLIAIYASLFVVLSQKRMIHLLGGQKIGYLMFLLVIVVLFIEKVIKLKIKRSKNDQNSFSKKQFFYILSLFLLFIYLGFTEHFLLFYSLWYLGLRIAWFEIFENEFLQKFKLKNLYKKILEYIWVPILVIILYLINFLTKLGDITKSIVNNGRDLDIIKYNSANFTNLWLLKEYGFETNVYIGFGLIVLVVALYISIFYLIQYKKVSRIWFYVLFSMIMITIAVGSNTPVYQFLYDYFPTFKFSRTPTKSIFIVYPIITILVSMIFSKFLKFIKDSSFRIQYITLFFLLTIIFSIYSSHSKKLISVVNIPDYNNEISQEGKILFLPMSRVIDPYGAINEFYLSHVNTVSMNGYDPFPKEEQDKIVERWAYKFNQGIISSEELEYFIQKYQVDQIVVLKKYFNSAKLPVPRMRNLKNDYEEAVNFLDSSEYLIRNESISNDILVYKRIE